MAEKQWIQFALVRVADNIRLYQAPFNQVRPGDFVQVEPGPAIPGISYPIYGTVLMETDVLATSEDKINDIIEANRTAQPLRRILAVYHKSVLEYEEEEQ